MAANLLSVGEFTPDMVFQTLTKQGLTESQAASFVGEWLVAAYGTADRRFDFKATVAATDPAAVAQFVRSFVHEDWEDGVSMVQASETPGELGFNTRFHRIEADLDALGRDVANSFVSLSALRQQVHDALDEARAELNRLNADVGRLSGPKSPFVAPTSTVFQGGILVGKSKFNGRNMQVWQTSQGMMMLPDLLDVEAEPQANARSQRVGALFQYLAENPTVGRTFPEGLSKTDLVKKFGGERTGDGTFVRDLVATLPDDVRYKTVDALAQDVADREAAALRTTAGATEAIAASLGTDPKSGDLGTVSVEMLASLAPAARQSLRLAGVDTLAQLSQLTNAQVADIAAKDKSGLFTAGDLARASGQARTVVRLR
jgi:hypothetical protein